MNLVFGVHTESYFKCLHSVDAAGLIHGMFQEYYLGLSLCLRMRDCKVEDELKVCLSL